MMRGVAAAMPGKVKVIVDVPESLIGPMTETMWAEQTQGGYRLLNSPFYARGLSYLDVVTATPTEDEGILQFVEKAYRSGHSTYRLFIKDGADWRAAWEELQKLGCTYEEALHEGFRLLSVDVPPATDVRHAYSAMEAAEQAGVWDFEEADFNHSI